MFEPKNEKAYWQLIYNYIETLPVGTVISYGELSKLLNADVEKNRASVYRARKELLKIHKRSLDIMRGQGYKVIEGMEIMYHAEGRHDSAKRQIKAAGFETKNINVIKLSADERDKLQKFMAFNANIRAAFTQSFDRIEQMSQISQSFTQSEVNKLKDMLK